MAETLINKKTIFSTEHIIGMNVAETKIKEQTFTNLMLGTEENSNDATENKGKTTLTKQ